MKSSSTQLLGYLMFIVAVLTVLLLLIWVYLIQIKPIKTAPFYSSQVGEYLLNQSIALAVQPIDELKTPPTIDSVMLETALQRQPDCLQRLQSGMQPSLPQRVLIAANVIGQRCDMQCQMQHLSNRLQLLNQAVIQVSTTQKQQGYLRQRYFFDVGRWAEQTCDSLGRQIPVTSAENTSEVRIVTEHVLSSVKQFSQSATRLLERGNIYWCERHRDVISNVTTKAQYCQASSRHVEFSQRAMAVSNPWSGLQGCLYLQGEHHSYFITSTRGNPRRNQAYQAWCAESPLTETTATAILSHAKAPPLEALNDPVWGVPQDLEWMMHSVAPLRKTRELWTSSSDESPIMMNLLENHSVNLLGYDQPVGLHIASTIHVERQAKLQQLANCFAGELALCEQLGLSTRYARFAQDFEQFAENAPVRTVGIVQIDIASGEIEALASGQSKCFTHDHRFARHAEGCPQVNYSLRVNPELLRNHAFFGEAQPASTNKPIIALSLMQAPPSSLAIELAQSNSDAFARHMFCNGQTPCPHPQNIQQLSTSMGWNPACGREDSNPLIGLGTPRQQRFTCGKIDPVLGRLTPIVLDTANRNLLNTQSMLYGRIGIQPVSTQAWQPAGFELTQDFSFKIERSSQSNHYYHWVKSNQHIASDLALGQANARVSPVGVAGLYAHLVRAAQGQTDQVLPHLIRGVYDQEGNTPKPLEPLRPDRLPITLNPQHATQVLNMMSGSSRRFSVGAGTAYPSCIKVLSPSQCNALTGIVAGKTGTPTVDSSRPYKWYAAAYRSQPNSAGFDKVIAVLVEPNWKANQLNAPDSISKADNYAADIGFWSMALLGAFDHLSDQKQEN